MCVLVTHHTKRLARSIAESLAVHLAAWSVALAMARASNNFSKVAGYLEARLEKLYLSKVDCSGDVITVWTQQNGFVIWNGSELLFGSVSSPSPSFAERYQLPDYVPIVIRSDGYMDCAETVLVGKHWAAYCHTASDNNFKLLVEAARQADVNGGVDEVRHRLEWKRNVSEDDLATSVETFKEHILNVLGDACVYDPSVEIQLEKPQMVPNGGAGQWCLNVSSDKERPLVGIVQGVHATAIATATATASCDCDCDSASWDGCDSCDSCDSDYPSRPDSCPNSLIIMSMCVVVVVVLTRRRTK